MAPGSFGEVTATPYIPTKAARAVAVVRLVGLSLVAQLPLAAIAIGLGTRLLSTVGFLAILVGAFFGVARDG